MSNQRLAVLLAVLAALSLLSCQSENEPPHTSAPESSPSPAPSAAPPSVSPAATPPSRHVTLSGSQAIRLWVYADTDVQPRTCDDLLAAMVPAAAAGTVPAKVTTCMVGDTTYFRYRFVADADGNLYLAAVEVLLLGRANAPPTDGSCAALMPSLIPADTDPATAQALLVCDATPLARGQTSGAATKVWARVPEESPVKDFPPDIHCWELAQYLGGPHGGTTFNVPCMIE